MSNGSGPIIIRALIQASGTTPEEKAWLCRVEERYVKAHKCCWKDTREVIKIVRRLLR